MKSLINQDRVWREKEVDEELVRRNKEKLNCSSVFARVVSRRYGLETDQISLFPEADDEIPESVFHPPGSLPDLNPAVDRIIKALEKGEDIFIRGDFDVDGLSSSALVYRALKNLRDPNGPGRIKVDVGSRNVGHGISKKVSARLLEEDFDLLITTDCGVRGTEEIAHLQRFGVDVIVTDHHEPAETLPPALAVVDPKREDSDYPNPYLAGAGVAFKLIEQLRGELNYSEEEGGLIQLAALGTVSDLVPLVVEGEDENRWIVRRGLKEMKKNPITGITALLGESGWREGKITPETVSYRIAPKLNSANRVGDPQVSFLLLATESEERANHLAKTLIDYDRDRSRLQNKLTRSARKKLSERGFNPSDEDLVFVVGDEWNQGIIGLIASRLASRFGLPAVAVRRERTRCRGSARGVEGVSVVKGLESCSDYLIRFGGHEMAGGFTASSSNLSELRECLEEWAAGQEPESSEDQGENYLDARLDPVQVNRNLYEELNGLAPFGKGNPRPKFWMKGLKMVSARRVGNSKNHLKVKLAGRGVGLDGIGFGMGEDLSVLKSQETVSPVFTLDLNEWRGREKVQLKLKDFLS
ncbi:MAG: single-stranded-DNA-specific exonuclease RecJ [Candidatus Acetothermia bacterium]